MLGYGKRVIDWGIYFLWDIVAYLFGGMSYFILGYVVLDFGLDLVDTSKKYIGLRSGLDGFTKNRI
jgi:phage-related holin